MLQTGVVVRHREVTGERHESGQASRARLFAPFPRHGPWTALGLGRGQFFLILGASVGVFVFWGGALWSHLGGEELWRLAVSYALIPAGVAVALYRNGELRPGTFLGATGVIAIAKLVVTAGIDLALGIAVGPR